jgi:hypothetical protein
LCLRGESEGEEYKYMKIKRKRNGVNVEDPVGSQRHLYNVKGCVCSLNNT